MTSGRFNLIVGLATMIAATFVGFALGLTVEPYFESGYAQVPFWRFLTRVAHTHGMPFGMINILFGILIRDATCGERLKRLAAIATATSVALPIGGGLRGVTHGAMWAEGLAMLGGSALLVACLAMLAVVSLGERKA